MSTPKIKKRPEHPQRVKALRVSLEKTQEQFAEMLGVEQPTVTAWERETGGDAPSPKMYMKLGNRAPDYKDALWFWQQAGMDIERFRRIVSDLHIDDMSESMGKTVKKGEKQMETQIEIPLPPSFQGFTEELQEQWCKRYTAGVIEFRQLLKEGRFRATDVRHDERRAGLHEANRMLRVPPPTSYESAMALPDWQCLVREKLGSELRVLTIDAQKFRFAIPPEK